MERLWVLDEFWVMASAVLVFFMQAGFMCFEVGNVQAKSITSVAIKNLIDWVIVAMGFYLVGFGLMFGESTNGILGHSLFAPSFDSFDPNQRPSGFTFLIFQTAFATTAATIVSGALAERVKFFNYLFIAFAVGIFIYPLYGHWVWGNALIEQDTFLSSFGYIDFAGSAVVHMVGGSVALVGVKIIGPRLGRFREDGSLGQFPTFSKPWGALGVFILALGWWGFNGGSVLAFNEKVPLIILNTTLAGVSAGFSAYLHGWFVQSKFYIFEKLMGGILCGLVAITASANIVTPVQSLLIGTMAGILHNIVFDLILCKLKLDDPVGAIAVHLGGGLIGIVCVAIFGDESAFPNQHSRFEQLGVQLFGAVICIAWSCSTSLILFSLLKKTIGLRVSPESELRGIDLTDESIQDEEDDPIDEEELTNLLGVKNGVHHE